MYDIQKNCSVGKKFRVLSPIFMREKVNKMASNVKTLNICALDPNLKWIHDDLILSCKDDFHDATTNLKQHWSY